MVSERTITQNYPETPEDQKDPEGRDTGPAKGFKRPDDEVWLEPSGKKANPTGEPGGDDTIVGEFNAVEQPDPGPVDVANVDAVKTPQGTVYFYNPPQDAERLGFHREPLGTDLGAAKQKAIAKNGALQKATEDNKAQSVAEMANRKVNEQGREEPDDDATGAAMVTHGGETTNDVLEYNQIMDEQLAERKRLDSEATQNETRINSNGQPETDYDKMFPVEDNDRDRNVPIEAIAIEQAGSPEFAPQDRDADGSDISAGIPQEARDSPHEPLKPGEPYKSRVYGVKPDGEFAPEPKPPVPQGPELEL